MPLFFATFADYADLSSGTLPATVRLLLRNPRKPQPELGTDNTPVHTARGKRIGSGTAPVFRPGHDVKRTGAKDPYRLSSFPPQPRSRAARRVRYRIRACRDAGQAPSAFR
mgnify:CR=1 FL=1